MKLLDKKKHKNNIDFIDIVNKYKMYIVILLVIIIVGVVLLMINRPKKNIELIGPEKVFMYVGQQYIEFGYRAYDSKNGDCSEQVIVDSDFDINDVGEYQISYKLDNKKVIRKVIVLERPDVYYEIILKEIDNQQTVYLKVGEEYQEPGYNIFDNNGNDLTSSVDVEVTGEIDVDKEGAYTLIYSFIGPHDEVMYVKRDVIVTNNMLSLSLIPKGYSSSDVNIIIKTNVEHFSHLKLPDGKKIYNKNYIYSVSENGIYTIEAYDKNGTKKEAKIVVNNIDKVAPSGSCYGNYKDGVSNITVEANDDIGIAKYVVDDVAYTTGNIVISKEMTTANIIIYDNAGNTQNVSCDLVNKNSFITLKKSTDDYTKSKVDINVSIQSDYFDYLKLPDGKKIYDKNYIYSVSENGMYTFEVYDKDGVKKESSIVINNIDKVAPSGSCYGNYKDGVSNITVEANDNVGISKYVINGVTYTNKNIKISKEMSFVNVMIYDKVGNTKNISCSLEDKNEVITSDSSITFTYNYYSRSDTMSYGLYTPSSVKSTKKTPLIVWLHGSGEVGVSQYTFNNSGLLNVLNKWDLDGFNAYVLCPQLINSWTWSNESSRSRFEMLLDKIIADKNIDTDKIILVGHSLGGQGAQYLSAMNNRYSAVVVLSGYPQGASLSKIKAPIIGYVGTPAYGEFVESYNYMLGTFKNNFGSDNLVILNTSHGGVPGVAFKADKNNDGKSDLVEWMLAQ